MHRRTFQAVSLWLAIALALAGCGLGEQLLGKTVVVSIVYGSEKREWLEPLAAAYNAAGHETADGERIEVQITAMGSIEAVNAIIAGTLQPTVWSPASSIYIPVANAEWQQSHADDLVTGSPKDLVLSPVVVAMWKPMAEALGWPAKALGWADIAALATDTAGWSGYGYPEWGSFKFGHTHPGYSNSGVAAILAETYAGLDKQRGLTLADLNNPAVREFVAAVESGIIHYGTSTGFFAERMFARGPSYLSAAVMYENLVVAQESKRLSGASAQLPVVAIYPQEGTFWSNHPYAVLNAPWVTAAQRAGAEDFQAFLLDTPQQLKAIELGFRPADPAIPLTAPLDAQHGVDVQQPQTVLEVPPADVIQGIQALWLEVKKPVDLVAVIDVSGSMEGDKITAARASLVQFVNLLDGRDQLQVIAFNDTVTTLTPLSPLAEKREDVARRVSGIIEDGGTALYDAVAQAYAELEANGDPDHIRAIVVLSDGVDQDSSSTLDELIRAIGSTGEESGRAIKVFTIAFGEDADPAVLKEIAEATGGQQYNSDPQNVSQIYGEIATFF